MDRGHVAAFFASAELPEQELDAVTGLGTEREFAAGDTLITEGDFGHSLFLIEDGSADVLIDETVVRIVGPGDVVGEIAVLASGRRTASVVATSPLRAWALFKRDVWTLEQKAPEASRLLRAAIEEHRKPSSPP